MPIMISGIRMVPMTNDLVRTIASNSRLKITNALDMCRLDLADDVCRRADLLQEDLLERRLTVIEPLQANAALHQLDQQRLRIAPRLQRDLRGRSAFLNLGDQW